VRGVEMIHLCALAVIMERGRRVIPPSVSPLADDEEDFLQRHVDELRADARKEQSPRGRFREGSRLLEDLQAVLTGTAAETRDIANELVDSLAKAMRGVANALDCVVAVVTDGPESGPEHVSLLKLDAEIEAAQLQQMEEGIRLRVFRDLLPSPGELQKGLSWPDPRAPESTVVIKDRNPGHTAFYFQNAFGVDASPTAVDSERALVDALADNLSAEDAARALDLIGEGGPADEVVTRIRERYPDFRPDAPELGAGGALAGRIRPRNLKIRKKEFHADGIDLYVPLDLLGEVTTVPHDGRFETRITTSTPLTPVAPAKMSDPAPNVET
jgi:hypothetical protein